MNKKYILMILTAAAIVANAHELSAMKRSRQDEQDHQEKGKRQSELQISRRQSSLSVLPADAFREIFINSEFRDLLICNQVCKTWNSIITLIMASPQGYNFVLPNYTTDLWNNVFFNGSCIIQAIYAAKNSMKIDDPKGLHDALCLYKALVNKGYAFDAAARAAQQGTNSDNPFYALRLYQALVDKGYALEDAALAAQQGMNSNDFYTLGGALSLYQALVNKRHALDNAAHAAKKGMNSNNPYVLYNALGPYEALVNIYRNRIANGDTLDDAIYFTQLFTNSSNSSVANDAQQLAYLITDYQNNLMPYEQANDETNTRTCMNNCIIS